MSQSTITCITQDSRGFMWFGTVNGLNRFDGSRFHVYQNDPEDSHSLSANHVLFCLLDQRKRLWFITEDCVLNRYDPDTDGFFHILLFSEKREQGGFYITTFMEDSSGRLWVGTWNDGLICYDPKTDSLKTYDDELDLSKTVGAFGKRIRTIVEDKNKTLWIGTSGGLVKYDEIQKKIFRYPYRPLNTDQPFDKSRLNSPYVRQILEDRSGRLWIGMTYGGLQRFDHEKKHFISYPFNSDDPNSFPGNSVHLVYEDPSGRLWVACRSFKKDGTYELPGFVQLNPETGKIKRYPADPNNPFSLSQNNVLLIGEDSSHRLWLHTFGGGIDVYDPETDRFTHFSHDPKDTNSLSGNGITFFYEDKAGTIWLGTEGNGVSFFDATWKKFPHYLVNAAAPYRQSNQMVARIQGSLSGMGKNGFTSVVWLGTYAGLNRWNRIENTFTFYEIAPKIPDIITYAIVEDRLGNLWVGTQMGLYRARLADFNNKKTPPEFDLVIPRIKPDIGMVHAILPDSDGNLWLGVYPVGLGKFNPKTKHIEYFKHDSNDLESLMDNRIINIFPGQNGTMWIPTFSGLDLFDPKTGIFTHFFADEVIFDAMNISWLYEDPDGIIWLGVNEKGLQKYDPHTKKVVKYLEEDGLSDNMVHAILPQKMEKGEGQILWLSTENGLCRFDVQSESFEKYDRKDGLQSNEFNRMSAFLSPDGEMFFGGVNGFNAFYSKDIHKSTYTAPVFITDFKIFNQSVKPGEHSVLKKPIEATDSIKLSYKDWVISFEFASLHFATPEKIQYAYFLEGFEKDWNYCLNRQFATYTNLPPGDYTFRIKATNCDGVWNETGTSIALSVSPPFWQTWWFKMFVIILFSLSILAIHKKRMQNLRIRLKTENEINQIYEKCKMTSREIEIINLLKKRKSYKEIEDELFISYHTVKNHVHNIFKKLGVTNRAELIYYFKSIEDEVKRDRK